MMATIVLTLIFLRFAIATPIINFSINAQLPPTAEVSASFEFVFLDSTFASNDSTMTYSLSGSPSWLSLDGDIRSLHGFPTQEGPVEFGLVAADSTGTTSMSVTLLVVEKIEIESAPLAEIFIDTTKSRSSGTDVLLLPSSSFDFSFANDTFSNTSPTTKYYAVSSNNSPLPSWLIFDGNLGFSGTSPPLLSSTKKQVTSYKIVASNNPGFADVAASFTVTIEEHVLAFNQSYQRIPFSANEQIVTANFVEWLQLDGASLASSSIEAVAADAPDWLTFDKSSISLKGRAPAASSSSVVTIDVTYGAYDASMLIYLQKNSLFKNTTTYLSAVAGEELSYSVAQGLLTNDSVSISIEIQGTADWLRYDEVDRTLHGKPPPSWKGDNTTVAVIASFGVTNETGSIIISVQNAATGSGASQATATASNTSTDQPQASSTGSRSSTSDRNNKALIFLVVLIPVSVIVAGFIIICRRRRKKQIWWSGRRPSRENELSGSKISRPIDSTRLSASVSTDLESLEENHFAASSPPRLAMNPEWGFSTTPEKRKTEGKHPTSAHEFRQVARNIDPSTSRSSDHQFEELHVENPSGNRQSRVLFAEQPGDIVPFQRDHLNYSRKRPPVRTDSFKRRDTFSSSRHSEVLSFISSIGSPCPQTRLSGAGHGAGGVSGPLGWGAVTESWQKSPSFDSDEVPGATDIYSSGSVDRKLRRPGELRTAKIRHQGRESTIRMVKTDSQSTSPRKRVDFIRERARDGSGHSPYFAAKATSIMSWKSTRSSRLANDHKISHLSSTDSPQSTFPSYSQSSGLDPPPRSLRKLGNSSIGQRLRESFRSSPRLRSRCSFGGSSRYESAESLTPSDFYDIRPSIGPNGEMRWSLKEDELSGSEIQSIHDKEVSPKLNDGPQRRPTSVARVGGFQRTEFSQRGNLAFL